jgi:hypothetical protein
MSDYAVLGPVDPQVGQYPAASILNAVARKPAGEVDDQTLILADQAQKAMLQLNAAVVELLGGKVPPEKAPPAGRGVRPGAAPLRRRAPIEWMKIGASGTP